MFQCVAVLRCVTLYCRVLQSGATHVSQCVAVCCPLRLDVGLGLDSSTVTMSFQNLYKVVTVTTMESREGEIVLE